MTRADVDAILGPRFTWREDLEAAALHIHPPVDATPEDERRLRNLQECRPVWLAIKIEGNPYR